MIQRRLLGLFFVLQIFTGLHAADVTINVDATQVHQTWYGFGCTPDSGILATDTLTASQRAQYVDMLFNQVRIRTCQVPTGFEAPATSPNPFVDQANDDSNPFSINWNGFNTQAMTQYKTAVADLASPGTTGDLYADARISTRWGAKWLTTIQTSNYNTFLDECAEQVLAQLTLFKNAYGREPLYAELFNEPTSGNMELVNGTDAIIIDIIVRCGDRLRANGFNTVKFVVPAQETEDKSLSTAQAIFANASAAKYVGAIAYHTYPYGSKYSYIPNILSGPGTGNPDPTRIAVRNKLRDLGKTNGVPVWMTEVSNGFYGDNTPSNMTSFKGLRGRAIHIHDEMLYAEISSFYGMNGLWSMTAQQAHFGNTSIGGNPDDLIFVDQPNNNVYITATGRAIGHYARFMNKGAQVLTSTSSNVLVQVTSANDVATGTLAVVLINNDSVAHSVALNLSGMSIAGNVSGEQSTASAFWQPLTAFPVSNSSSYTITVPALSVTSLAAAQGSAVALSIVTNSPLASGTVGTAYSTSFGVSGGTAPYTWSVSAGSLPPGLTLNASGTLSGTPTAAGTSSFTTTVRDNVGSTASKPFSLTINPSVPSGPIAYWHFDEGSGTTASDATGNGHTGTLVNAPSWAPGVVNTALKFTPASNNYIAVADFAPPAALTLEAWVNPGSNSGTDSIILDKHNLEYDFRINGAGNLSGNAGGTALTDGSFNFYSAANANQWYHVVYTFDNVAQTHALYRNGVRVASGANTAAITNQSTQLWIGRHSQFNFGTFMGSIDEVRIYARALSAAEVLADYNAQKPAPPVPVITSGPTAAPNPALTGQTVTLTVSASEASSNTLTYSWTFGDGSTATGSSVTHAYAAAGTFTATATVSDGNGGTATGSTVVTVNNPAVFTLTTATAGTGAGSITLNPPGGSYAAGTLVTLTAAPATGSTFAGWSGGASGASNPLTITVNSNLSVTATFNLSGLIAWWKFDEGSGSTANDSSGNGHTGTLVNAPAWVAGVKNTALNFVPSSNSYVAIANFTPPAALTLEAWIYPGNNAGLDSIILNKHNLEYDFRVNGLGQLSGGAGGTYLTDSTFNFYSAANVNQWYHVVYTFDNAAHTHTLYRNGVQVATASNNATITGQSTQLWVGRHSQYNFGTFRGSIDEVRMFQRPLSAAEVFADYNAMKSGSTSSVLASASAAAMASGSGILNVAKLQANVKFNAANADACSISGTIQSLPSDFKPAGQTAILDLGGAVYSFVLSAKAQGKSSQGSVAFKISKSHKATPNGVTFSAKLAKCSLAGSWALDPTSSHTKASIDTYVSIDIGGNAYDTLVTLLYSSKANAGAKVKK